MKLAIFCPNWVGDAVMATPALRALREHFPSATLIGVLRPYVAGILEGSPWLDQEVLLESRGPSSRRWPAVAAALRKRRIDIAVLLSNSFRSALIASLAGCRRRAGYVRSGRSLLLTDRLRFPSDSHGRRVPSPAIDAYNAIVQAVGCPQPNYRMELFTTATDEAAADAVWDSACFDRYPEVICLNPGAAFGPAKQWPEDSWAALAQELVDRRGCAVLVLCGPSERDLARRIVAQANRSRVFSLADQPMSLGLTKACVRRCHLLITTDSGPRHFAAAFDRPVLTLFGPTHIAWTETYFPKAVHLQKKVDCGPCQLRVCPLDHRCMKQLTAGEVLASVEDLLRRFPPQGAGAGRRAG